MCQNLKYQVNSQVLFKKKLQQKYFVNGTIVAWQSIPCRKNKLAVFFPLFNDDKIVVHGNDTLFFSKKTLKTSLRYT